MNVVINPKTTIVPGTLASMIALVFSTAICARDDLPDGGTDEIGALDREPGLEVDGRLGAVWTLSDAPDTPVNEFEVTSARLELTWTQWKLIEASVSVEASEIFHGEDAISILRDLYVLVQPLPWLGVRMGQFKKPFSRTELTSRRKLPFIDRGLTNDYIVEHLLYGDRDIGFSLEGRLVEKIKLDYAVGIFNGMGMNASELSLAGSKDAAARLETKPAKWLSLGANVSLKLVDKGDLPGFIDGDALSKVESEEYPAGYTDDDFIREHSWMAGTSWMTGADMGIKYKKLRVAAEGQFGENWWFEKYPYMWSALLTLSYKLKISRGLPLWLVPALRGEVLTILTSTSEWRARLWQIAPALNLHIGKYVRLMINGEFVFAQGSEADVDGSRREGLWPNEWPGELADSKRLMVQFVFDK